MPEHLHAFSHITGGGITENIPRILSVNNDAEIDTSSWQRGAVFDWLAETGNIEIAEMRRTFNCGVGMVVIVSADAVDASIQTLNTLGEHAWPIGRIVRGDAGSPRAVRYI